MQSDIVTLGGIIWSASPSIPPFAHQQKQQGARLSRGADAYLAHGMREVEASLPPNMFRYKPVDEVW
jgi:hypothetical protein